MKTEITRNDIITMVDYAAIRKDRRRRITKIKQNRRVHVGPDATFYFECYDTMWHQIHEMLFIEGGGESQIEDELLAYNSLIPNGKELVATLMFEIDDPVRRDDFLSELGGVERTVTLSVGNVVVSALAEIDVDRTSAEGKASSIQFLHFPFSQETVFLFCVANADIKLSINHQKYEHIAKLSEEVRMTLAKDFS